MEVKLSVRMDADQEAALKAISAEDGVSVSEVIRSALSEFIQTYQLIREREEKIESND